MGKYISNFSTTSAYEAAVDTLEAPHVALTKDNMQMHYKSWGEIIAKFNVSDTSSATKICNSASNYFNSIEIDGTTLESVVGEYTFSTTGKHTVKYTLKNPTSIGNAAFRGCSGLTNVIIPNSVTNLGSNAFQSCSALAVISVAPGNTKYDSRNNCNAIIETASNTLIAGCKNTIIPNSVTSIGQSAFSGCSGLTDITIPDSVTEISFAAFGSCSGLTSITIGNSVTNIGSGAFLLCSGLNSIICNATTAPTIGNDTFQNVKTGGTLYVPSGSTGYNVWMGTGTYYLGKYEWTKIEQ